MLQTGIYTHAPTHPLLTLQQFIDVGASKEGWNKLYEKTDTLCDYKSLAQVTDRIVLDGLLDSAAWQPVTIDGKCMGRVLDFQFMHTKTIRDMGSLLAAALDKFNRLKPEEWLVLQKKSDLPDGTLVVNSRWNTDASRALLKPVNDYTYNKQSLLQIERPIC